MPDTTSNDEPRAVQNGMSQYEYDTWMFLADKEGGKEPYTYIIKQSDLTNFIKQYGIEQRLDEVEETKYAIMRGEYGHSEVSIIKGFGERIAELTALKYKENK